MEIRLLKILIYIIKFSKNKILERNDLSKPSKMAMYVAIIESFQVFLASPEDSIRLFFYFVYSIERR